MTPKAVAAPSSQLANAPVLALDAEARSSLEGRSLPGALRIEVPTDIRAVLEEAPERAAAWRAAVRDNFQWALGNSYEVAGLYREPVTSRSFYTLVRQQS
jgi:predicted GNAT superfamily acetyltransferase